MSSESPPPDHLPNDSTDDGVAHDRSALTGPGQGNEAAEGEVTAGKADRLAQPVLDEGSPRLPFTVVGIGASAGGLEACIEFFKQVPADSEMAFVVVQHLSPEQSSRVAEILARHCSLPTTEIDDGMEVKPGHVYVIRPARTLTIEHGRFVLSEPLQKRGHRHPIDDFFRSLAEEQRERAVAVVLSGMGSNGAAGAAVVNSVGGLCIAQDPGTAAYPSMPQSLIDAHHADYILPPAQIPEMVRRYVSHPYTKSRRAELVAQRDRRAYDEIISVLRTRTHQEFAGYKKPTVMRRIQRRMGIHHTVDLAEYAALIRQNAAEARALAEEIVIHVTGFFRDPQAWETLRERVIEPLVAMRIAKSRGGGAADGEATERAEVRAWVTACSTGEEPYTLAILLHEAVEKAGRRVGGVGGVDVKVFATDLVERTLSAARSGYYPLGIEAEVNPARLERYFEKDDMGYRIKKEIREIVVFAPQNVLRDPPFSRLDIVTCRNLLIYLEPQVQQRLLGLLHFGLRAQGVLMLGNSETVSESGELFDPISKKWRIYRKVGPSRTGRVDFPTLLASVSRAGFALDDSRQDSEIVPLQDSPPARSGVRTSIAHLAQRALLERHCPASVVIDRTQRIVYYHGDTGPFLAQPHGEPTRDLLSLVREEARGAVRLALHRALDADERADRPVESAVTVRDGHITLPEGRMRMQVTVAPLGPRASEGPAYDYWLVSFGTYPEPEPPTTPGEQTSAERARNAELVVELERTRDELEGTIEELQASNEELKAANEEITSINEELQSTNEELETSKEELQSYNEELSTVNSQLQTKMEELEATSNDLASLLGSTDIAVIFLDRNFRIRRFTAAVRTLVDLIPADVGRPLTDFARKFTDPQLLHDAQQVLERLIPIEREVEAAGGRKFMRRLLPYRTADNHIDGVVITFVEITRLRAAERAEGRSQEQYNLVVDSFREHAVIALDADGRINSWSAGAQALLGYTSAEAVGRPYETLFSAEDRAAEVSQRDRRHAQEHGQAVSAHRYIRKDGARLDANAVTSPLYDADSIRGFVTILQVMK